jgi:signal transduction histidine kinase
MGLRVSRAIVESYGGRMWAAAQFSPRRTLLFHVTQRGGAQQAA